MTGKAGALGYLIVQTTRNRIQKQAMRVRNPRYAFALLFGLGYLWLTFLRPGAMGNRNGAPGIPPAISSIALSALLFATVIFTWLLSKVSGSLAFLPAEVHFLFPAPLTRRDLIAYRVVRSQLVVLLNAFVWSIILRRFGLSVPAPVRFGTAWALFSLLTLHQLGAALILVPGATGLRRMAGWAARGLAGMAVLTVVAGLMPLYRCYQDAACEGGIDLVTKTMTSPPISVVFAPFRLMAAPMLATSTVAWLGSIGFVLLMIVLHLVWVLSMDVPFTETAVIATAKRAARVAALRAARSGNTVAPKTGKVTRQWLPLAPVGPPTMAIAWKNTMSLIRGAGSRTIIVLLAIGVPFVVMSRAGSSEAPDHARLAAAIPYVALTFMTLLMGPRMLRNDLRQDLLRLSTLKTFPLKGSTLVAGEIISPTLVLTIFQLLMVTIGYTTVPGAAKAVADAGVPKMLFVAIPFVFLALNGLNVVIQNGVTLMFPSWVRLGADSGGIEAMGQNMLMTFGSMFALMLALLLPVGAAAALIVLLRMTVGTAGLVPGIAVGTAVGVLLLAGEIVAMVNIFGRTFERMDPTQIG